MNTEWTNESAQAAIARWNILFPLEDRTTAQGIAYSRLQAEARAQQIVVSQEIALLDETALATGKDVASVAMAAMIKHAKWLGLHFAANGLADAKRDNQEACAYLDSLKAQEKER